MNPEMTLYELLEVSPRACPAVIKAAWRCLAQANHPDKLDGALVAMERQAQINAAYAVLSNPHSRQRYDRLLGVRPGFVERRSDSTEGGIDGRVGMGKNSAQAPVMRAFAFRPLS